jgi:membrane protein
MNRAEKMVHGFDRFQQRRPWLAFPVAVWKKFSDDQAGNLAALIAYYGFASLFPLLLVFVTVLKIVLHNHPSLQAKVRSSTFARFPGVGSQLAGIHSLSTTGAALVIGLILTFLAARGVAGAVQNALNTVWAVPYTRRPGFPWSLLRSIALAGVIGLGFVVTSALSGLAAAGGGAASLAGRTGSVILSLLLNIGAFWLGFRLATAREITGRELFPGAVLAGAVWQVLQYAGGYLVNHQIARSHSLYGEFGLILGLLAWLYLQAQFTLYAVEVAVVRARRLWPRSLAPPPVTPQDLRAYELQAQASQRRPEQQIVVRPAGQRAPND